MESGVNDGCNYENIVFGYLSVIISLLSLLCRFCDFNVSLYGRDPVQLCSLSHFDAHLNLLLLLLNPLTSCRFSKIRLTHFFSLFFFFEFILLIVLCSFQERNVLFNPKAVGGGGGGGDASGDLSRPGTRKAMIQRPVVHHPLLVMPTALAGTSVPHHDVVEPGPLLSKQL